MGEAPVPADGTPVPGRSVRGSQTGRPIMAAFDLLGRRWALRILWELRDGPVGFRALQQRCGDVSPTVLNTRLGELRSAGLVEQDTDRAHRLTPLGRDLRQALVPLQAWAERWAETRSGSST
ncbi:winged helix-turn-helix transcriptional regulator [Streptomyces winkii]|uniref:winged helix-turn-helix transcriptional regulator n=1 Tax=Streptomyces winkii TaxID=3051178 RepID=UPI0028D475B0|nr:helix-turn-helix domain-containing protein [Streptomyces sp. DSM 40971]